VATRSKLQIDLPGWLTQSVSSTSGCLIGSSSCAAAAGHSQRLRFLRPPPNRPAYFEARRRGCLSRPSCTVCLDLQRGLGTI
jgi:hypothetical protein